MGKGIRTAIIAAVLIVLAYPASAWLIGLIVESQLQQREQQALEKAPYLVLVKREYTRGVYRATEELTYSLRGPFARALGVAPVADAPPSLLLKVRNTIRHGPLPQLSTAALATIDTEVMLPSELRATVGPSLGAQPLLTAHSRLGWSGGSSTVMQSPPIAAQLPQGGTFRWRGIHVTASSTRNQRAWTVDAIAPGLSVRNEKFQLESEDLRVHAVMQRLFTELDVGTTRASIARLDIQAPATGGAASMQQLSVDAVSSINGDYVDSKTTLAIAALHAHDFSASKLAYVAMFNHLHAQTLDTLTRELRAAARDLYAGGTGEITGTRTRFRSGASEPDGARLDSTINPAPQKLLEVFRRDGVELLLHDPALEISRLGFTTIDGQFNLSLRIKAPGLTREDFKGAAPATVASLMRHLDMVCDLQADTRLLDRLMQNNANRDRVAAQLGALEGQGYLKRQGSALSAHLVFTDGKLTVNGLPYPPGR